MKTILMTLPCHILMKVCSIFVMCPDPGGRPGESEQGELGNRGGSYFDRTNVNVMCMFNPTCSND